MLAWLVFSAASPAQQSEFPLYTGRTVCLECHAPDVSANPCSLRPIPAHLESFGALTQPEAAHIADISGVAEEPTQCRVCLECHTTGSDAGSRWMQDNFVIADGIQCEACHGAGSFHVDTHRSGTVDPSVLKLAALRISERSDCKVCHIEKPTHTTVLEQGYRIPPTDRLYKTPVNMALSPDARRLYVVCEHSDSLIVLEPETGRLIDEVTVGQRPQDVALSPDGRTIYVTNRFSATLSVLSADRHKIIAEVSVGHEPHGVLTDVRGERLFVLNTGQDSISVLDAKTFEEIKRLSAGAGPWSLALRADGRSIAITSVRPQPARFRDPSHSELTMLDVSRGVVARRAIAEDANMLQGIAFIPGQDVALFTFMRTKNLIPITRLAQGWGITNGVGVLWSDGRVDQLLLDQPNASFPDPTDVAVSPDGRFALVVSGGSDRVAVLDVATLLATITGASDHDRRETLPNHLGFSSGFVVKHIAVGSNPRAVIFSPDGQFAYVANALDDSVTVIDAVDFSVARTIPLGGPETTTEIRHGERLFHSADNAFGQQFSCRSCHPDGHINGLTFDIEADGIGMHPVDNRTLRGIFDTPPFKWEGTNPSFSRQCGARLAVFFTRLAPFSTDDLQALVRYMRTIERPPNHHRDPVGLTLAQRRGKAVFQRTTTNSGATLAPEQRCVHCHNGGLRTARRTAAVGSTLWFDAVIEADPDNLFNAEEYGELGIFYFADTGVAQKRFDAPHLVNIYASPPYLHNGAATTLEEIWTRYNMLNGHGLTGDWTRQQLNDLVAYLKTL